MSSSQDYTTNSSKALFIAIPLGHMASTSRQVEGTTETQQEVLEHVYELLDNDNEDDDDDDVVVAQHSRVEKGRRRYRHIAGPPVLLTLFVLLIGLGLGCLINASKSHWSSSPCVNTVLHKILGFALLSMVVNILSYLAFEMADYGSISEDGDAKVEEHNGDFSYFAIVLATTLGTAIFWGACASFSLELIVTGDADLWVGLVVMKLALIPWMILVGWITSPPHTMAKTATTTRRGKVLPTMVV